MAEIQSSKNGEVDEFIRKIQSADADVRYAAWKTAGPVGPEAVAPLGDLLTSPDKGIAKAAKGALENIAHHAARPRSGREAQEVSEQLLGIAASNRPRPARAEALHLLGFTADRRTVPGIARLLSDPDVRDEARMALERIPGGSARSALSKAAQHAPADFRPNLEQSLHNRALSARTVGREAV